MRFDLYHHFEEDGEVLRIVKQLLVNQEKIMATLDEVLEDVQGKSTVINSLSALISGLQQQIKDALANVTIPPDAQAKIDQIFAAAETNKAKLAAALTTPGT